MSNFACTFCRARREQTSGLIVMRADACICRACVDRFFLEMARLQASGAQFLVLQEPEPTTQSLVERAVDKGAGT